MKKINLAKIIICLMFYNMPYKRSEFLRKRIVIHIKEEFAKSLGVIQKVMSKASNIH